MCGRFTQTSDADAIAARFAVVTRRAEVVARYNIAPTDPVPVVVREGGARALELFRWGLIPYWTKALRGAPQPINAKVETVARSAMFRGLLPARRCLVVADGFYEWTGAKKDRRPLRIVLKDRSLFAFAGLWDAWRDPDKRGSPPLRSCTIVTVDANPLIAPVHDRMPAILKPEDEARWLDPALTDPTALAALLAPYPAERLDMYPVSSAVNNVRNQGPECIEPAASGTR